MSRTKEYKLLKTERVKGLSKTDLAKSWRTILLLFVE